MMIFATKIRSMVSRSDESGSALVEFALTSIVLLMVIFGIIECSRALYVDHFVAYAAREAARYAMVRGSSWPTACPATSIAYGCNASTSASSIQYFVTSIAPDGISTSKITTTPTWAVTTPSGLACSAASPGCVVNVKVSYSFNFSVPFLPTKALTLASTSAVVIAQ